MSIENLKRLASALGSVEFHTEGFEQIVGNGTFYGGLIVHEDGETLIAQCVLEPWASYLAAANPKTVLELIAELEARTPAAPVVAEGLDREKLSAMLNRLSLANRRDGWTTNDPWKDRDQIKRAKDAVDKAEAEVIKYVSELAAHPVAGSPAEAEPDGEVSKMVRGMRINVAEAEPMPASEDTIWLMTTPEARNKVVLFDKAEAERFAAMDDRIVTPYFAAAPVPASEAASVNPAIIPESRVREMVVSAIDRQFEKRKLCAQKLGVAESYLSGCLNGDRLLTDDMLAIAGIKRGYLKYSNLAAPAAPTDAKPTKEQS